MRLRQIEVFYAISQAGTISGAAKALNVSQPNISRVLSHTEQQLGFLLFERSAKGLMISKEGLRLLPEVKKLITQLQSINALTDSMHPDAIKAIRIGAAHACSQMIVAPILVNYRQQKPHIHVDLLTEHFYALQQAVLDDELDVALVFGQAVDHKLLAEPLIQANMVAIAPKQLKTPKVASLSWLCEHNFLMMQEDDPLGSVVHRTLAEQGLYPDNPLLIKTYSVIADMVVSGGGVAVVDIFTASRYANDVQIIPLQEALCFELVLISRSDKPQSRDLLLLKSMFKAQCQRLVQ
ncbi:LysR family transcriptional regulator [Psychromonas aquatilis]|uniref:LysR family transcriptional regulator n=1 Tax=Psychromonas aquatilis TaxID=2005072 RepID=A0ABU9GMG1_9GAMM